MEKTLSAAADEGHACAVLLPIQPKTGYYARIMLGGFNDLFCSKLCRHNIYYSHAYCLPKFRLDALIICKSSRSG